MDVLHFLRSDHEAMRRSLDRLDRAAPVSQLTLALEEAVAFVEVHLGLEKDYLYPEISGAFNGVDAFVATGLANGSVIEKKLKAVLKILARDDVESDREGLFHAIADLKTHAFAHFDQEERLLLPKLREFVRTEDREDLGQILQDVQEERLLTRPGALSAAALSRRRA